MSKLVTIKKRYVKLWGHKFTFSIHSDDGCVVIELNLRRLSLTYFLGMVSRPIRTGYITYEKH